MHFIETSVNWIAAVAISLQPRLQLILPVPLWKGGFFGVFSPVVFMVAEFDSIIWGLGSGNKAQATIHITSKYGPHI